MIDIIFVHNSEGFCDRNLLKLKSRFPLVKILSPQSSLSEVLDKARNMSFTKNFWIIDGSIEISDDFNFSYNMPDWDSQYVHSFQYTINEEIKSGKVYLVNKKYNREIQIKHIEQIVGKENKEIIEDIEDIEIEKANDIIFVHTGEQFCDRNFNRLKTRFPMTRKILSNKLLNEIVSDNIENPEVTDTFWLIDGSIEISDDFNFSYSMPDWDSQYVHSFQYTINEEIKSGKVYLVNKKYNREIQIKHIEQVSGKENGFYDIVFISYHEPNYEENYQKLRERFPNVMHVNGVKGIHQAHIQAAKISHSEMIWIVDADALIVDDFNFDYVASEWDLDTVHVWRSKNPINGLIYGYGGVKLFPRKLTLNLDTTTTDMTTSISTSFKAIETVSNITAFNTDPFNTWKSAFRECVKLSSKIINKQNLDETNDRLNIWMTVGKEELFGTYCIDGANDGYQWGIDNANNKTNLSLINNFEWLRERFNKRYG